MLKALVCVCGGKKRVESLKLPLFMVIRGGGRSAWFMGVDLDGGYANYCDLFL